MSFSRRFFDLFFVLATFSSAGHAVTLDWDGVTWTPGSLSNPFNIDPASAGNDVTVTVSGNTSILQQELAAPNPMTPAITTAFAGGAGTASNTLCIAVNFAN